MPKIERAISRPATVAALRNALRTADEPNAFSRNDLSSGWARDGHTEALTTAADAVTRFAEGALGLVVVEGQTN